MKPKNFITVVKKSKKPLEKPPAVKKLPPRYADGLKPIIKAKSNPTAYLQSWRLEF